MPSAAAVVGIVVVVLRRHCGGVGGLLQLPLIDDNDGDVRRKQL